jgi:hypothetical protein
LLDRMKEVDRLSAKDVAARFRILPQRHIRFVAAVGLRNPDNVRVKYIEIIGYRGPPILFPLSEDPSPDGRVTEPVWPLVRRNCIPLI